MGILEGIRRILADRRETKRLAEKLRGFNWAKNAHYKEGESLEDIEIRIHNGLFMDGPNPFDQGAAEALNIMVKYGDGDG